MPYNNLIAQVGEAQKDNTFMPCPRCGHFRMREKLTHNALSRHGECYICERCGMDEAIRDMTRRVLPAAEWAVCTTPELYFPGKEVYV